MSQTPTNPVHRRSNGGALALLVTGAMLLTLSLILPTGAGAAGDPSQVDPLSVPTTEDATTTTEEATTTTEEITATTEDTTASAGPASTTSTTEVADASEVSPGDTVAAMNVPYSSEGKQCDESRDGWHLVMNGVETSSGNAPTAADFGPVILTFSGGSSGTAIFTDASGDKVAHFLDATTNQTGAFTLVSALMTFPAGTTVTGYGNFVISHPPCGTISTTTTTSPVSTTSTTEATTTTTEATTTTTEATTTTEDTTTTTSPVSTTSTTEDTTTTTSPVSTETTSTTTPVSIDTSPTTGLGGALLITGGDGGTPIAPQAVSTAPASGSLPSTGIDGKPFIVAGLVLMASGGALWITTRRRAEA